MLEDAEAALSAADEWGEAAGRREADAEAALLARARELAA
jgi:hypothetical protein